MLILVFGPTGAGKSTLIRKLVNLMGLTYVIPQMTRTLRPGEQDREPVRKALFAERQAAGQYIWVNSIFGVRYGTPRRPTILALRDSVPSHVLDFPLENIEKVENLSGHKAGIVIMPPSKEALISRLVKANRKVRIKAALEQYGFYIATLSAGSPTLIGDRIIVNNDIDLATKIACRMITDLARQNND